MEEWKGNELGVHLGLESGKFVLFFLLRSLGNTVGDVGKVCTERERKRES